MTTIAAVQGKGWAVVGYDSRVTDDSRTYVLPKDQGKVVENGEFLFGAAGDMRAINLMGHVFRPPTPAADDYGTKLDKFFASKFIPALKSCFDAAQYGEKGEQDSHIIVVVRGVIYDVGANYDWCRDVHGFYAVGSGSQFALGALNAMAEGKNRTISAARKMVEDAVAIACRFDPNSAEPIYTFTQRG